MGLYLGSVGTVGPDEKGVLGRESGVLGRDRGQPHHVRTQGTRMLEETKRGSKNVNFFGEIGAGETALRK